MLASGFSSLLLLYPVCVVEFPDKLLALALRFGQEHPCYLRVTDVRVGINAGAPILFLFIVTGRICSMLWVRLRVLTRGCLVFSPQAICKSTTAAAT